MRLPMRVYAIPVIPLEDANAGFVRRGPLSIGCCDGRRPLASPPPVPRPPTGASVSKHLEQPSTAHLHRYLAEYDFRYNHRVRFGINDQERAEHAILGIVGKRLTYQMARKPEAGRKESDQQQQEEKLVSLQLERFKEAARPAEADETGEKLKRAFRRIVPPRRKQKPPQLD